MVEVEKFMARRIPKQKRSIATREKILAAGKTLFSRDGYHATSSKKIAREAGIAVGSFYNYFPDKKRLLMEIHREHVGRVHAMVSDALHSADLGHPETDARLIVKRIVDQTLKLHDFSPALHREISALIYTDPDFADMGRREENHAVQMLKELLALHPESLRISDLEAAARVVVLALEEVVHTIKIFGAPIEESRLLDALGDMVYRFLYEDDCGGMTRDRVQ